MASHRFTAYDANDRRYFPRAAMLQSHRRDEEKGYPPTLYGNATYASPEKLLPLPPSHPARSRLFTDPLLLMQEALREILVFGCRLFVAPSTLAWSVLESRLPPNASVRQTFYGLVPIFLFLGWLVSTSAFLTLHCVHLAQVKTTRRHWSTLKPPQNFVLRVVATASLMALGLHICSPVTLHLALTYGPPVVSGAAWLNSLWEPSGNSLNMAAAMG